MSNTLSLTPYPYHQNTPTTAMFQEDSDYQNVIDKIYRIHGHGLTQKLSIPQMAIVGDQSSGKSSVLEAITKLSFPRGKNMCTRFAILVNLRRNPALQEDVLTARIEGEDDFNNRFKRGVPPMTFNNVIEKAGSTLCSHTDVSEKVLEITLTGPTQSPLTIIDLPGFINTTKNEQDKGLPDTIGTINSRHIKDSRTIILAVVQASIDLEMSTALSFAGMDEHDPKGERTIPIITKPDQIARDNQSEWVNVILNRVKTMKLGYLVMRNANRHNISWDEARREEDTFFNTDQWNEIPSDRKGRVAVKKFLGNLLYEHISRELPALKCEAGITLDALKRDLNAKGTPIATTDEARRKLCLAASGLQLKVTRFLDADYDPEYIAEFKDKPIPSSKHTADDAAGKVFTRVFDQFSRLEEARIQEVIRDKFQDESAPFTISRLFRATLHKERIKNDHIPNPPFEPFDTDVTKKQDGSPPSPVDILQTSHIGSPLPPLQNGDLAYSSSQRQQNQQNTIEENMLTTKEMVTCLTAYLTTAIDRIVDKVLMETIERYMVKIINEYFKMVYSVSDEELVCMLESSALKNQRLDLETKIADLESILAEF
ncbi:hypothetical protein BGZ94_003809 [Podila epigama]|nr:hypothetical protein BGZ94_003809 [Podila epigama]